MQGSKSLEDYSKEIEPKIRAHRAQVIQQLQVLDKDCNNKHIYNEGKYVECMFKLEKRIAKHSRELEFGLIFWKHQTFESYDRSGQDISAIKDKQTKQLDEILHKFQL